MTTSEETNDVRFLTGEEFAALEKLWDNPDDDVYDGQPERNLRARLLRRRLDAIHAKMDNVTEEEVLRALNDD